MLTFQQAAAIRKAACQPVNPMHLCLATSRHPAWQLDTDDGI